MTALAPVILKAKTYLLENQMGLDGFEFVEFASPKSVILKSLFEILGFNKVTHHRSKNVTLFWQGDINFVINNGPTSHAADHLGLGFTVCI